MSPPASNDAPMGSGAKPKSNIYTVLMAIALVFIILATVLLWLEMGMYEYKKDARRGPSSISGPAIELASAMPTVIATAERHG